MAGGNSNFEYDGIKYYVIPHTGRDALNLDRRIRGLWVDVVNNIKTHKISDKATDAEKFSVFGDALSIAMSGMEDEKFERLVTDTFKEVVVCGEAEKKEPNKRLASFDEISEHFFKNKGALYVVMINVWEINRFGPFE